jgi:hypothetical protein
MCRHDFPALIVDWPFRRVIGDEYCPLADLNFRPPPYAGFCLAWRRAPGCDARFIVRVSLGAHRIPECRRLFRRALT